MKIDTIRKYYKLRIQDKIANYNKRIPLIDDLVPFVPIKSIVRIADVGSGPFSFIGSYLPGIKMEVCPSDKQDFTNFWKIRNQSPFIPVDHQNMEKLTYPDNSFDIVFCSNALDHTRNAKEAVRELIRICKVDGWVVIICSLNQLDTGYLHFWNAKEDGTFDNHKEKFNLKDFGFNVEFEDGLITATLKK